MREAFAARGVLGLLDYRQVKFGKKHLGEILLLCSTANLSKVEGLSIWPNGCTFWFNSITLPMIPTRPLHTKPMAATNPGT